MCLFVLNARVVLCVSVFNAGICDACVCVCVCVMLEMLVSLLIGAYIVVCDSTSCVCV